MYVPIIISTITINYHFNYSSDQFFDVLVHFPPKDRVFLFLGRVVGELCVNGVIAVDRTQCLTLEKFVLCANRRAIDVGHVAFSFGGAVGTLSTLSSFHTGNDLDSIYKEITDNNGDDGSDNSDDSVASDEMFALNNSVRHRNTASFFQWIWGKHSLTKQLPLITLIAKETKRTNEIFYIFLIRLLSLKNIFMVF